MRIVSGLARGRRLAAAATATRPTSDRAREGLFNSLTVLLDLDGARVLDLYAGTGAVGLEALSRGARETVLVESDRSAVLVLRRNISAVGLPGATVRPQQVDSYLATPDGEFDFVFADPPYDLAEDRVAGMLTRLTEGRLAPDAVVVLERSARGHPPAWPDLIEAVRHRRYGEGVLWYGRRR